MTFGGTFRLVGDVSGGGLGVITNPIAQDTAEVTINVEGRNDAPTANAAGFAARSTDTLLQLQSAGSVGRLGHRCQ